jgi:hypothetical protein
MKFKERNLYVAVIAMLLVGVFSIGYYEAGKEVQRINKDRTTNRVFATQTYFQAEVNNRLKMRTLMFVIMGIEGRSEDATAIRKVYDQAFVDFQKLEMDYELYMDQNMPIRSLFPPFMKEFPELQNPEILLYKLKED